MPPPLESVPLMSVLPLESMVIRSVPACIKLVLRESPRCTSSKDVVCPGVPVLLRPVSFKCAEESLFPFCISKPI